MRASGNMTRRRWLWVLGVASVGLFAVLAVLDVRMTDAGGWGIVDFELAGGREDARRIVADWGSDGHDAALASLWIDYPYMAAYGAFGVLAVAALRDLATRRGWARTAALGRVAVPLPAIGAGLDALENVGLLLALGDRGGEAAPVLAAVFAAGKFLATGLALLYGLAVLVRNGWARRRTATALAAALLTLAAIAVVAVGLSSGRETEGARPGGDGRVLRIPGGDVYVEDSAGAPPDAGTRGRGPVASRGAAAIVLVHGYTGSTRWWSRVAADLARRERTIAVDLLGHGRSAKPRDGYGMDEQARRVLSVLRRLDIRRAVVVGHSMGGWVAVSMAEQDPELVRGVAVIGTAADRPEGPGELADRAGYVPVAGPALWKAVPRAYVRSELETAFAPEVEVPDAFVDDTRRLTWRAYAESARAGREYREDLAPYLRTIATGVPLLAILGTEDERAKAHTTAEWDRVPRGRVVRMRGVGHTPPWERPGPTAAELRGFAEPLLRG